MAQQSASRHLMALREVCLTRRVGEGWPTSPPAHQSVVSDERPNGMPCGATNVGHLGFVSGANYIEALKWGVGEDGPDCRGSSAGIGLPELGCVRTAVQPALLDAAQPNFGAAGIDVRPDASLVRPAPAEFWSIPPGPFFRAPLIDLRSNFPRPPYPRSRGRPGHRSDTPTRPASMRTVAALGTARPPS